MENLKSRSMTARKTAIAIAAVLVIGGPLAAKAAEEDNSAVLNIPGTQNEVTSRMNAAAAYASNTRLGTMNSLYQKPLKTPLQQMTCLQKIMNIQFTGLSSFSFSGLLDAAIQAAIQALIQSACSMVDTAWDSAMGKLSEMTTVDMGSAGTVSVGQSGSTVGFQYNTNNPYLSSGMKALTTPGVNPDYGGFKPAGSQSGSMLGGAWEAAKNLFK